MDTDMSTIPVAEQDANSSGVVRMEVNADETPTANTTTSTNTTSSKNYYMFSSQLSQAGVTPATLIDIVRPMCDATANLLKAWPISEMDVLRLELEGGTDSTDSFRMSLCGLNNPQPSIKAQRWAGSLPEAVLVHGETNVFTVAATDTNCLLILATWKRHQILATEAAGALLDLLALRFISQLGVAKIQAQFKNENTLPDAVLNSDAFKRGILSQYQLCASHCANQANATGGGYALFMQQGTGKTICTIEHIEELARNLQAELIRDKKEDRPLRVLVLCPKNVRTNWRQEFKQFATLPHKIVKIEGAGTKLDRTKGIIDVLTSQVSMPNCRYSVLTMSYGAAVNTITGLRTIPWDLVVLDESHNIKSKETTRWRKLVELRDACKRRLILTGTPIANTLNDIWTQLEFLGKGWSGFNTYKAFKAFYGVYIPTGQGFEALVSYQNVPLLQERLARLSFIISLREALPSLPTEVHDTVGCELEGEQKEAYEKLRDTLRFEIEDALGSDLPTTVTINNVLVMLLRLSQVSTGYISYDAVYNLQTTELIRPARIDHFDTNPKLEELVFLCRESTEENSRSKKIIWTNWIPALRVTVARLKLEFGEDSVVSFYGKTSDPQREEAVNRFNKDPKCKFFVGNPGAGGIGINLLGYDPHAEVLSDYNCDHEIYLSMDWSMLKRSQSQARAIRRGTRVHVRVTDIIAEETIDEEILDRVMQKCGDAMKIQDLREILSRVLKL